MDTSGTASESIWHRRPSPDEMNAFASESLVAHLGIRISEVQNNGLVLTMPVDRRTVQPLGILHGGASVALAETAASIGAHYCVDSSRFQCMGIEINANHIRAVREGLVTATASPLHLGRATQVWSVSIVDEERRLVCISRVTIAVVPTRGDDSKSA